MPKPQLKRVKLPQLPASHLQDPELLKIAETVLGYCPLQDEENREKFRLALETLSLDPFSAESVQLYSDSMIEKETIAHTSLSEKLMKWGGVAFYIGFVSAWMCGAIMVVVSIWTTIPMAFWALFAASVAAGSGGFVLFQSLVGYVNNREKIHIRWFLKALREYTELIPNFALATAIELKKKLPEIVFFIQELRCGEEARDRLLVAKLGNQTFFLETWRNPLQEKREA